MTQPIQEPIEVAWRTIEYLREELRAAHATIGDLRLRLAATERHCHDLQAIVETLRGELSQAYADRDKYPPAIPVTITREARP